MVLHSSQQLPLPFLLQTLIYLSVPFSDTGHDCSLMRLFRSSGELETMVPIILLATRSIAQENLCAGGYCFLLLALFSLYKEVVLLGVHLTAEVVIFREK